MAQPLSLEQANSLLKASPISPPGASGAHPRDRFKIAAPAPTAPKPLSLADANAALGVKPKPAPEPFKSAGVSPYQIQPRPTGRASEPSTAVAQAEPPDFTDKFNTMLDPQQEAAFRAWSKKQGRDKDTYDYDLRGWWLKNGSKDLSTAHLTDEFKKPNHPTFSKESQYSGADGFTGGEWQQQPDGSWAFAASDTNLKMSSPEALQQYFARAEKGNKLVLPGISRPESALHQVAQSAAESVYGTPQAIPILRAGGATKLLTLYDRVDAGEDPNDIAYDPNMQSMDMALASRLQTYQSATPEMKQRLRTTENEAVDPRNSPLYSVPERIISGVKEALPTNPAYEGEFLSSALPQAGGSMAGFLAGGAAGKLIKAPVAATVALTGAAQQSVSTFKDALAKGASIETAVRAANATAPIGASEAIPIGSWLNRLDKATGGKIKTMLINALKQGSEEALQELFQGISSNALAQGFYDPERGLLDGTGQAGGAGFTVGAVMQLLGDMVLPGKQRASAMPADQPLITQLAEAKAQPGASGPRPGDFSAPPMPVSPVGPMTPTPTSTPSVKMPPAAVEPPAAPPRAPEIPEQVQAGAPSVQQASEPAAIVPKGTSPTFTVEEVNPDTGEVVKQHTIPAPSARAAADIFDSQFEDGSGPLRRGGVAPAVSPVSAPVSSISQSPEIVTPPPQPAPVSQPTVEQGGGAPPVSAPAGPAVSIPPALEAKIQRVIGARAAGAIPVQALANKIGADPALVRAALASMAAKGTNRIRQSKDPMIFRKLPVSGPQNIFQFIASKGGIRDDGGELRAILDQRSPAYRQVVRRGGQQPDMIREAAIEAGFLPEGADLRALYDAMSQQSRGAPVMAAYGQDATEIAETQAATAQAKADDQFQNQYGDQMPAVQAAVQARGMSLSEAEMQQAAVMVGQGMDPDEAVIEVAERSAIEAETQEAQNAADERWKTTDAPAVAAAEPQADQQAPDPGDQAAGAEPAAAPGSPPDSSEPGEGAETEAGQRPIASPSDLSHEAGSRAYSGMSFEPGRRATSDINQYVADVNEFADELLKRATTDEMRAAALEQAQRYKENYIRHQNTLWAAKSRTLSPMITGPARFPTARNQKRLDTEMKRIGEFLEWRKKARASAMEAVNRLKPADQVAAEEWEGLKRKIDRDLRVVAEIDSGKSPFDRRAFSTSLSEQLKRRAANGETEIVRQALDYIRQRQTEMPKPIFAPSNSVWGLVETAQAAEARQVAAASSGPRTVAEYEGGVEVIDNAAEDRTQIFFPGKPSEEIRAALRGSGWKWSPRNEAWQRQMTQNARDSAKRILDQFYKPAEQEEAPPAASPSKFQPAYHGSPHDFDKFSTAHIGTGEGAQAYGWGLYFAGRREVADYYKKKLAVEQTKITIDGEDTLGRDGTLKDKYYRDPVARDALGVLEDTGSVDKAIAELKVELKAHDELDEFKNLRAIGATDDARQMTVSAIEWLEKNRDRIKIAQKPGRLYTVDIPEDNELLDYDKKMSEQPPKVQQALETISTPVIKEWRKNGAWPHVTGKSLYQEIASHKLRWSFSGAIGKEDRAASMALKAAGIPGLRYADQGSRGKDGGSHNYVIFDDSRIKTLSKFQRRGETTVPLGGEVVDISSDAVARQLTELDPKAAAVVEQIAQLAERITPGASVKVYDRLAGKFGGKDFEVNAVVTDPGVYAVINMALNPGGRRAKDGRIAGTFRHEAIHWLRHTGIITTSDWQKLADAAERGDWIGRHGILEFYSHLGREGQIEEAVAERFRTFLAAPDSVPAALRPIWGKIARFFRELAARVRGIFGRDATAADILTALESGKYQKERVADGAGPRAPLSLAEASALFQKPERPTIDQTDQGEQRVIPGAERITDRELVERKSEGPAKAKKPQKDEGDLPLFDTGAQKQGSLFERVARGPGLFGNSFGYTSPQVRSELLRSSSLTLSNAWARIGTQFDLARIKAQDKMLALKRVQQAIEEARGAALPSNQDAYTGEELYHGTVGEKLDEFRVEKVEPLIKAIADNGLTVDQVNDFLEARHAPERNAQIAKINPEMPDGGSGITNAEAEETMNAFRANGQFDALSEVAKMVDEITGATLDQLTKGDLIDGKTRALWKNTYKHYVPLRGWEAPESETEDAGGITRPRTGKGFDVRGPESKRAMGRGEGNRAGDILAHVIAQYEEAVVRAGKNEVAKRFLRLAEGNPDPDLWEVGVDTATRRIDPATGMVTHGTNPDLVNRDNVLAAKIGGEVHYVTIHDPGLARAMKNLGVESSNGLTQALGKVMRYFAAINTQYNPAFAIPNLVRDIQTAITNIQAEDLPGISKAKLAAAIVRDILPAFRGAVGGQRGKVDTEMQRYYREFAQSGGKISFFGLDDVQTRAKKLRGMLEDARNQHKVRAGLKYAGQWISDINGAVENATRLSVYKNLRDRGVQKEKAASIARNLTVNFNRKGEWGSFINSLYLFYNAAIQGNYAMVRAIAKSRRVKGIVLASMVAGALWDSLMSALSPDDDETGEKLWDQVSDFDKAHNLIFINPWATSKDELIAAKIPLPYGYNIFPYTGVKASELLRDKPSATVAQSATDVVGTAFDAFNPLGSSGAFWYLPTMAKPVAEIEANTTFSGAPMMPDKEVFGEKKPDSELYFKSARRPSVWAAEKINEMTGGSAYREGFISWSPETLDHWFDFATGGLGKFLMAPADASLRLAQSDKETPLDWPVVSRFTVTKKDWYADRRYRELNDAITAVRKTIEAAQKAKDSKTVSEWRQRFSVEMAVADVFRRAEKRLTAKYRGTSKDERDEKFETSIREIENEAIRAYIEALEKQRR